MKKSFIVLFIGSIFLISACEDSNLPQKVFEAEKKIVQLEADLQKNSKELSAKESEINELKKANEILKTQVEQNKNHEFPALKVNLISLFQKSEHLTYPKEPDSDYIREADISLLVNIPKTNITWLDKLLLDYAFNLSSTETDNTSNGITEAQFTEKLNSQFDAMLAAAKEEQPIGLEYSLSSYYHGQRNNITTFSFNSYEYVGGAHGIGTTYYMNVNTDKKTIIRLDDLISKKNQPKLKALLWEKYESEHKDEKGKYTGYADKADFRVIDNFYFQGDAITFVYPVYELAPYAEGETEITLSRYELNSLLNQEYQYTAADGWEESKE